jgi:hypothetical protein
MFEAADPAVFSIVSCHNLCAACALPATLTPRPFYPPSSQVGAERVMFEAADPAVFSWYV